MQLVCDIANPLKCLRLPGAKLLLEDNKLARPEWLCGLRCPVPMPIRQPHRRIVHHRHIIRRLHDAILTRHWVTSLVSGSRACHVSTTGMTEYAEGCLLYEGR